MFSGTFLKYQSYSKLGAYIVPAVIAGGAIYSKSSNGFWGSSPSNAKEFKYVVLGGGNASGYAAWEFVKQGVGKNEVCIITDEPYVAYERPALSKAYLSMDKPPRLPGFHTCVGGGGERQAPEWYKDKHIEYITNTRITKADVSGRTLTSDKGDQFKYDKLIVATGARVMTLKDFNVPGSDLKGLFYLRNVEDADELYKAMKDAHSSGRKKALVVGGGYIGMECAAKLLEAGLDVTLVFPEQRLMERLFTKDMAEFYENIFSSKGAKFIKGDGALVTKVHGSGGRATGVSLKNGQELEADIIVVGTGARPNTELFQDQLQMAPVNPRAGQIGGIQVNQYMQTSDPNVYAVGDVAAFPLIRYGHRVTRQEHVTHCRSSAQHAVRHIMDPRSTGAYDYLPFFYSRIFNLSWQYYGTADGEPVFFKVNDNKIGSVWVDKNNKIVGAFLESGNDAENAVMRKLADLQPNAPKEVAKKGLTVLMNIV